MTDRLVNQAGIDLIKSFEGLNLTPYLCPAKIWTNGYGHTSGVTATTPPITEEQAEQFLQDDLGNAARGVMRMVRQSLNDNQFAALVSFAFNVGLGNFESSTLLQLLNRGFADQVPFQLVRWDRAGGNVLDGLVRRRAAEAVLWNKSVQQSGVA